MKNLGLLLTGIGVLTLSLGGLRAKDYTLADFKLGEVLHGTPESFENLTGKVVVIEFWGVQCPPCLAKMPHLVEMNNEFAEKGLRLFGAEMQRSSTSRIESIIKSKKINFTITRGCSNPVGVNRLPHMAVFDVDGKLVYNGYPDSDADRIIKRELARVVMEPTPGAVAAQ